MCYLEVGPGWRRQVSRGMWPGQVHLPGHFFPSLSASCLPWAQALFLLDGSAPCSPALEPDDYGLNCGKPLPSLKVWLRHSGLAMRKVTWATALKMLLLTMNTFIPSFLALSEAVLEVLFLECILNECSRWETSDGKQRYKNITVCLYQPYLSLCPKCDLRFFPNGKITMKGKYLASIQDSEDAMAGQRIMLMRRLPKLLQKVARK